MFLIDSLPSNALPLSAAGHVDDLHALGLQLITDAVGLGKALGLFGILTPPDQRLHIGILLAALTDHGEECGLGRHLGLLFALVSALLPMSGMLVRLLVRLALLPVVVAISYECNRFVGRHDNRLTRILSAPGMWFQHFTTNEPDDSMIEVAIEALKLVIPDEAGADRW